MPYAAVAIPLRRPDIVDFLTPPTPEPKGAAIQILAQRPTPDARSAWADRLRTADPVSTDDLLAIDDPHRHLIDTHTDRLVPVQFLEEPGFLTRNLGGWSPVYFAVAGLPATRPTDDPLYRHLEILTDYGERIPSFGADPAQVADRLADETDGDANHAAASLVRLHDLAATPASPDAHVRRLYRALEGESALTTATGRPVPNLLLADALLDRVVRTETHRRAARANGESARADRLERLLQTWEDALGLSLLLKGEYIAGRHRRSTILVADALGIVVKQPGMEPRHEIELDATVAAGESENWPRTIGDGAVVTPRGRLRRVLEEEVVPRLHRAFDHGVQFSALLGTIVEDYVDGPTVKEFVTEDPDRLTPALYERILATQQACERLGVNNPDWHAANFIVESDTGALVHIDWGAAHPLPDDAPSEAGRQARIDQVANLAYSFQDDTLAEATTALHRRITQDETRMERVRRRAEALVSNAGG
jgi:hypothetical protein